MVMLKWTAILLNLGMLGFMIFLISKVGISNIDSDEFWATLLLLITPSTNLVYFYLNRPSLKSGSDKNILELWLQVKKEELQKRLD
jgi:hypothetical protein